jgi:integrase
LALTEFKRQIIDGNSRIQRVSPQCQSRLYPLFLMAVLLGLRQGELLALEWDDLNLDADSPSVSIRGTLTDDEAYRPVKTPPKTASAYRTFGLPFIIVAALIHHRESLRAQGYSGAVVANRISYAVNGGHSCERRKSVI